jgi:hypothetical protein
MIRKTVRLTFVTIGLSFLVAGQVLAQDQASAAAQANNPLANMTAFNMQNYYIGDLTKSDDSANQFWFRYARPFSVSKTNWLMRASLPVNAQQDRLSPRQCSTKHRPLYNPERHLARSHTLNPN